MFQSLSHRNAWLISLKIGLVLGLLLVPLAASALPARADDNGVHDPDRREVTVREQVTIGNQVQTTIVIPASQATFVASNQPDNNFGYQSFMGLGWSSNPNYGAMRILLKFSLGSIPSNATISSATFQIYQYQYNGLTAGKSYQIGYSTWTEANATWNNANNIGSNEIGTFSLSNQNGWRYGNATGLVQQWYSGAVPNNGVMLQGLEDPAANQSAWFYSNYPPQPGLYPQLVVQYTSQASCDNLPPVVSVNSLPSFEPNAFQVSWSGYDQAPAGCQPTGIANYDVYYQLNNGDFVKWLDKVTSTSATFTASSVGAVNGTIVGFRARGCDNAGNCQAVGNAQTQTTIDTQGPTTTMNPLPTYTSSSNFTISWSGNDYGMVGVASYTVQQSLNGGAWTTVYQGAGNSHPVTGAQTGQTYAFRAQAVDNLGNVGSWSSTVSTTIFTNPFAVLTTIQPSIIKPTSPVTSTINLHWTGYTPAGTTITQYVVWYNYNNLGWIAVTPAQPGGTSGSYAFNWVQRGLGDGSYLFKVTATNSAGAQTPSNVTYGQASVIVDMANAFQPRGYFPLIFKNAP